MAPIDKVSNITCPLLDKIPAEIRNNIYELAFTADNDEEQNLAKPASPNKALLLSCRRVYQEARGMYREAYRKYWKTSLFVVDRKSLLETFGKAAPKWCWYNYGQYARELQDIRDLICQAVSEDELKHISSITAIDQSGLRYVFADRCGAWRTSIGDSEDWFYVAYQDQDGLYETNACRSVHEARETCGRGTCLPLAIQIAMVITEI